MKEKYISKISGIVFCADTYKLCVYSLNSRLREMWKRIGFTMICEEKGIFREFSRKFWDFEVWADFGRRLIGKEAEYTYRKLGH